MNAPHTLISYHRDSYCKPIPPPLCFSFNWILKHLFGIRFNKRWFVVHHRQHYHHHHRRRHRHYCTTAATESVSMCVGDGTPLVVQSVFVLLVVWNGWPYVWYGMSSLALIVSSSSSFILFHLLHRHHALIHHSRAHRHFILFTLHV